MGEDGNTTRADARGLVSCISLDLTFQSVPGCLPAAKSCVCPRAFSEAANICSTRAHWPEILWGQHPWEHLGAAVPVFQLPAPCVGQLGVGGGRARFLPTPSIPRGVVPNQLLTLSHGLLLSNPH